MHHVDWRLYVILDPEALPATLTLLDVAAAAIEGGAGVLQLRDKRATSLEFFQRACQLADLCRVSGATFIVNDRLDIAMASNAHGVHLGPHDLPVAEARRLGPNLLIGASAGSPARASELVAQGADYLGVGALYEARGSKPDASPPRGPALVAEIAQVVPVPLVGIGGIDAHTAPIVAAHGAAGIAVIRAVSTAASPREAARALLEAFEGGRPQA